MTALMRKPPSKGVRPVDATRLTDVEKAMLFDAAMAAVAEGAAPPSAHVLAAFATAYVAIRDQENGIV